MYFMNSLAKAGAEAAIGPQCVGGSGARGRCLFTVSVAPKALLRLQKPALRSDQAAAAATGGWTRARRSAGTGSNG